MKRFQIKSRPFEINENLNSSNFEDDSNNSMYYSISDIENNILNTISDKEENMLANEFILEHNQIKEIVENKSINDIDKLDKLSNIITQIIYPINKGEYNGNNFYKDKHLYLLTKNFTSNIRYYPDYIKYEENNSIKDNKKRYFRSSVLNYELNEDYYLCFKKTKLLNRRGNNHHIKKINEEYDLFRIPNVKNIIGLLEDIHLSIFHLDKSKFLDKLTELKIYYNSIYKDIDNIYHLCDVCLQKIIRFYKCHASKQLIMEKPKQRYVVDLTYLPIELYKNNKYKYIFNILDYFSNF